MKKLLILLPIIFLAACDKDFEEINTNPTAVNDIDPKFMFTTSLLQGCGNPWQNEGAVLAYASCFVQHIASVEFNWQGDKYLYDPFHNDVMFLDAYIEEVKTLVDLMEKVKDDPAQTNLYAAARIWKAVVFHRITDLYGDVPYSQAGLGFLEGDFFPAYDSQEDIYFDLLAELETACTTLDAAQPFIGEADLIYHGDVEKWRRFGYTIMLRLGLRLVKVDEAAAENWVRKAITGGVMQSLDDSALVPHSDGDLLVQNGIGYVFAINQDGYLAKTFVDWMAERNDPRLHLLSNVAAGTEPKGLPHGIDRNMLIAETGSDDLTVYSQVNWPFVQRYTPTMIQGYAEAEFMLAEAGVRGWTDTDETGHYEAGVWAAMQQLALFDGSAVVDEGAIENYLLENPFAPANENEALETINSQYWAATFLNGLEAFANWRRSGYPELTPASFPGNVSNGTVPRRLRYPQKEFSVNEANIQAAINRQGPDDFTTRVWWDK